MASSPDPGDRRAAALGRAGWRCVNPECRSPLTLDVHHLHPFDGDGEGGVACVCPRCHAMQLAGVLPAGALRAWTRILQSLQEGLGGDAADQLLLLDQLDDLALGPDGLLRVAPLLASGLVEIRQRVSGLVAGQGADIFKVRLSAKGKQFVAHWRAGNQLGACAARDGA